MSAGDTATRPWSVERHRDHILVRFAGPISAATGRASAAAAAASLASSESSVTLVCDAREVAGYDRTLRHTWMAVLGPHRGRIRSVVVVSVRPLVHVVAGVMALALGLPIDCVSELPRELHA